MIENSLFAARILQILEYGEQEEDRELFYNSIEMVANLLYNSSLHFEKSNIVVSIV